MLTLALGMLVVSTPPAKVAAPRLHVGDELVYTGVVVEESLRIEKLWKRTTKIEVRAFVLGVHERGTDLALLTLLHPQDNAAMARVAVDVNGAAKGGEREPVVRLELIRLDVAGAVLRLLPEPTPPPLTLNEETTSKPFAARLTQEPVLIELALFPPRPTAGAKASDTWTQSEAGHPDTAWTAKRPVVLDGAEVIEFAAEQMSAKWAKPNAFDKPWRHSQRFWLAPGDGIARVIWRRFEVNDGPTPATSIETRLDWQPTVPHRDEGLDRVRREIEFAWWFSQQVEKLPAENHPAIAARIRRYCEDYPATPFREAVESVGRRCLVK